ncbi:Bug family tripartite tricarboxylate transporter substrate binding protein [Aquabacter cavernae]|uniref:Bug family tripartite tricarboxylate transporter substrate binding protein n=1 Tax=Aquabacter cavernae TaxID=2496029 RepID=UPI000F8D189D|nr:tripartite tricarboxylate transporter substrate binding protein [Aquabacter cavernae]
MNLMSKGRSVRPHSMTRRALGLAAFATLAAGMLPGTASAQSYPARDVTFVVGYAPGGTGDVIARIISERLAKKLGKPVVVDNRPGASGSTAATYVAKAPADGLILLAGQTAEISINPFLMKLSYDPQKDLQPIALAAIVPLGLVTPEKAPYSTVAQMLEVAKATPGGLTFASSGIGTPSHFATELLKQKTGANFTHIPYKGAGPALNDILGGHVDLFFSGLPAALQSVRANRMKLMAVSSVKRSAAAPDVPTIAEAANIPGFDITLWVGFFAPKATPTEVITLLNKEINEILSSTEVKERFLAEGADISVLSVEETSAFTKAESAKYKALIDQIGVKLE